MKECADEPARDGGDEQEKRRIFVEECNRRVTIEHLLLLCKKATNANDGICKANVTKDRPSAICGRF